MAAAAWTRTAPEIARYTPDDAVKTVENAIGAVAGAGMRFPKDDPIRLIAAGITESAAGSLPHLRALPSMACPSAELICGSLKAAASILGHCADLAESGALDSAPVGQELTNRRLALPALLHLSKEVRGHRLSLAAIQASELRQAAVVALGRDLERTARPEPTPRPTPVPESRQGPQLSSLGFIAVLAVLLTLLFSRCTGDATPHSLAAPHAASTTWSIR